MNRDRALISLAALAQESRLEAFRLLVQAGPGGMAAGELAERLDISPPALSFHLRSLAQAGLVRSRQEGRFIFYNAAYESMQSLVDFLTENCCGGVSSAPARVPARKSSSRRVA